MNNYVKKFEELEKKREGEFQSMSKLIMNNQLKEGEINFSAITTRHEGIKCEKCGKEPIVGYRYKCSDCPNYNLCEICEELNSQNLEHPHNFIKIRNSEKKEKKEEKILNKIIEKKEEDKIEEEKKEIEKNYEFEVDGDLKKEIEKGNKTIQFVFIIKNINKFQWPAGGDTKLVSDENSEFKVEKKLNNLAQFQHQKIFLDLDISNLNSGTHECILNFEIREQRYGEPITFTVVITPDIIERFRETYQLFKSDYPDERISKALQKNNNKFGEAFNSLFE